MKYSVRPTPTFIKQSERIIAKYPKLSHDLRQYLSDLGVHGVSGKQIPGHNAFWKDRLPLRPYNIGKSKGLRLICYYTAQHPAIIIPALIYLKSELEAPTVQMLNDLKKELASL